MTGWTLTAAGLVNVGRLVRWQGWITWREPLVLMLHLGYAWLAMSLLALAGAILGWVLPATEAVHALTAGRSGRDDAGGDDPRQPRPYWTLSGTRVRPPSSCIFLVNLGAMVRGSGRPPTFRNMSS